MLCRHYNLIEFYLFLQHNDVQIFYQMNFLYRKLIWLYSMLMGWMIHPPILFYWYSILICNNEKIRFVDGWNPLNTNSMNIVVQRNIFQYNDVFLQTVLMGNSHMIIINCIGKLYCLRFTSLSLNRLQCFTFTTSSILGLYYALLL